MAALCGPVFPIPSGNYSLWLWVPCSTYSFIAQLVKALHQYHQGHELESRSSFTYLLILLLLAGSGLILSEHFVWYGRSYCRPAGKCLDFMRPWRVESKMYCNRWWNFDQDFFPWTPSPSEFNWIAIYHNRKFYWPQWGILPWAD